MNVRADQLLQAALRPPEVERAAVVAALVDSLDGADGAAVSESWRAELLRRREDLRGGRTTASPWAQTRSRISAL